MNNMNSDQPLDKNQYNFYNRINQFGEYKYNNRLDTLFIFQLSFILLLVFLILSYLNSVGLMSSFAKWLITIIFGSFVLLIFLSRVYVLPKLRDRNDWNKMNFGNGTLPPVLYNVAGVPGGIVGNLPNGITQCVPKAAVTCDN